ncbi:MAG: toll/interleukin-1 receptor domain-containing protein [Ignavibacteriales bacterium]|nr:toll/interleukin-1 receptor domain-containing protein [Ignavibacteriales bacterium]
MRKLKIFLSYNSQDSDLAGSIKRNLGSYGLSVFLAHEDIEPTQDWIDRLLLELNKSVVFIPILTESFLKSKWTSQEIGIALANDIFIISLKVDIDPFGFLSRYQALKFRTKNLPLSCSHITNLIYSNKHLRKQFLDGLIDLFTKSDTFDEAKYRSSLLKEYDGYTKTQVSKILRASIDNDQIYNSFGARSRLVDLFNSCRDKVDETLLKMFNKKIHR